MNKFNFKKKTQCIIKVPFVTLNVMHDSPQAFNVKLNLPYNEFKNFEHSIVILERRLRCLNCILFLLGTKEVAFSKNCKSAKLILKTNKYRKTIMVNLFQVLYKLMEHIFYPVSFCFKCNTLFSGRLI